MLSLAENAGLQSYTELQPLQQLSRLTRLDLSSPAAAMRLPQCQHTAVCQLTQLRHLALNSVIRTNRCADDVVVASREPRLEHCFLSDGVPAAVPRLSALPGAARQRRLHPSAAQHIPALL